MQSPSTLLSLLTLSLSLTAASACAEEPAPTGVGLFGQITNVTQMHPAFRSPYRGDNSLDPTRRSAETSDVTLYAGVALWKGAEAWINPEIDQGFGLSDTLGAAGFPSGEAYKVGANRPYGRIPRAFIRQTIALGGDAEKLEAAANQMAGTRTTNNLTLTFGKFGVTDIFDTNRYAHDPRADFLNWSVIDAGAFDYAADSWGFTYGGAAEWAQDDWTLRAGVFQLSRVPNGNVIAPKFDQRMLVVEAESRHQWLGHPGKLKLLAYLNRGRMGAYRDALAQARQTGGTPDTALVRRMSSTPGYAVNLEQELTADLGLFMRASANRGREEAFEFTEINRSLSAGFALRGASWGRTADTVGLAAAFNALTTDARAYLTAGGMGILVGDGALNYGGERVAESYYSLSLHPQLALTLDYQYLVNPAHNRDRGPVSIYGLRLHAEF